LATSSFVARDFARDEGLVPRAGKHDHADRVVGEEIVHDFRCRHRHLEREGVEFLGIVENEMADGAIFFGEDLLFDQRFGVHHWLLCLIVMPA